MLKSLLKFNWIEPLHFANGEDADVGKIPQRLLHFLLCFHVADHKRCLDLIDLWVEFHWYKTNWPLRPLRLCNRSGCAFWQIDEPSVQRNTSNLRQLQLYRNLMGHLIQTPLHTRQLNTVCQVVEHPVIGYLNWPDNVKSLRWGQNPHSLGCLPVSTQPTGEGGSWCCCRSRCGLCSPFWTLGFVEQQRAWNWSWRFKWI